MLKVEVDTAEPQERKFETKDGEEGTYRVQTCFLHLPGKKYPVEFPRRIPKNGKPLAPGWYVLDFEGAWLNYSFQRIELTLANLKPMPAQQQAAPRPQAAA